MSLCDHVLRLPLKTTRTQHRSAHAAVVIDSANFDRTLQRYGLELSPELLAGWAAPLAVKVDVHTFVAGRERSTTTRRFATHPGVTYHTQTLDAARNGWNLDAALAFHVGAALPATVTSLVIGSGDGDFSCLAEAVRERRPHVQVYALGIAEKTHHRLRRVVRQFFALGHDLIVPICPARS